MASAGRGFMLGALIWLGAICLAGVGCQSASNVLKTPGNQPVPPHLASKNGKPRSSNPQGGATRPTQAPCQCESGEYVEQANYRGPQQPVDPRGNDRQPQGTQLVQAPSTDVQPAVEPRGLRLPGDRDKDQEPQKAFNCPVPPPPPPEIAARIPTELQKVTMPAYVIEPPDILLLDGVRLVPKPPYRLQPLDSLVLNVTETFPDQPIAGTYVVAPEGTISLGFNYGSLRVVGMTVEEIERALKDHLGKILKGAAVSVALGQIRAIQQTRGEHLVHPDGTVHLGVYGCVNVTGMTLSQAKCAIEKHLEEFLQDPEISIDVLAYNSKSYYVIADGAGFGQQVYKFPVTGNETVLDAIERINGLPQTAYRGRVWVARPSPCGHGCNQVLPVDWQAIVQGGSTCTNYQLFPGDRVYIRADPLIRIDNALAKIIAPIERLMGITLLTNSVIQSFKNGGNGGGVGFIAGF